MPARFHAAKLFSLVAVTCLVLIISIGAWSSWQYQQFWQGCQSLPTATTGQSWYQGVHISFGYPSSWRAGQCRTDGGYESIRLTSRTSLFWRHHQPLGASNLTVISQDGGEQTLAKTLAQIRQQPFDGQRDYDTTRVDGADALVVVARPSHSHDRTTTVYVDHDDQRYVLTWTIRAWTDQQGQRLQREADSDQTYLEQLLATIRFD